MKRGEGCPRWEMSFLSEVLGRSGPGPSVVRKRPMEVGKGESSHAMGQVCVGPEVENPLASSKPVKKASPPKPLEPQLNCKSPSVSTEIVKKIPNPLSNKKWKRHARSSGSLVIPTFHKFSPFAGQKRNRITSREKTMGETKRRILLVEDAKSSFEPILVKPVVVVQQPHREP